MKRLDPLIHAPARLRLMGIVSSVQTIEFSTLRDRLEVSDSVLSKHLGALSAEGYVQVRKTIQGGGGRRRTLVSITDRGAGALARHVAALRAMAAGEL